MIRRIKKIMTKYKPKIYILPQVIYIRWLDKECFIKR